VAEATLFVITTVVRTYSQTPCLVSSGPTLRNLSCASQATDTAPHLTLRNDGCSNLEHPQPPCQAGRRSTTR